MKKPILIFVYCQKRVIIQSWTTTPFHVQKQNTESNRRKFTINQEDASDLNTRYNRNSMTNASYLTTVTLEYVIVNRLRESYHPCPPYYAVYVTFTFSHKNVSLIGVLILFDMRLSKGLYIKNTVDFIIKIPPISSPFLSGFCRRFIN